MLNQKKTSLYVKENGVLRKITESSLQTNPNLLDNPDFKINQRGKSTYPTENDPATVGLAYTVDRWWFLRPYTGVKKNENGILLTIKSIPDQNKSCFGQRIEYTPSVENPIMTASLYVDFLSNPNAFGYEIAAYNSSGKFTSLCARHITTNGLITLTTIKSIPLDTTIISFYIYIKANGATAGSTMSIRYAKLEYGIVATQFVPPHPATELTKCKRYYMSFNDVINKSSPSLIYSYAQSSSVFMVYYYYNIPPMRTNPSLETTFNNAPGAPECGLINMGPNGTLTNSGPTMIAKPSIKGRMLIFSNRLSTSTDMAQFVDSLKRSYPTSYAQILGISADL